MGRNTLRLVGVVCGVVAFGSIMGCEVDQLRAEREGLWRQNQELQDELTRSRMALDAAEADRGSLLTQLNELQGEVNVIAASAGGEYQHGIRQHPGC